jgi:NAD(P)-dependent dehydrogenase (short-subunit alcohol dehydrogenase family)
MQDLFTLEGNVALVAGGAGGIGRALSLALSRYGAKVVIADLNQKAAEEVATQIQAETRNDTLAIVANFTDESSVSEMVKTVVARFGRIDVLVNAMGLNIKQDALDYVMDDWRRLFGANVEGTMINCKHVGRQFKAQGGGGKIINMSSVRGVRGYGGGNSGYCATKGSVEMITKALAIEWAPLNIRVNALAPSLIITPGTVHIQKDPARAEKYKAQIPLGRLGLPEDLMGACVFLASNASSFVTGQTLFVDGGVTAS